MNPTRPSRTALVVAKSQALVGMTPRTAGLVPAEALRFVTTALRLCGQPRFAARLRHPWFRRLVRLYERLMIPGLALHHVLRKHAVEHIVRRELNAGATQVVQIGAGFDSLAYRLHRKFPNADFLERDHPATRQAKQQVIAALGGASRNLTSQPLDLTGPVGNLTLPDPTRRTVVIIEGVLMYLDPDRVQNLLRHLAHQLGPDSLLLFSFMDAPGFHRQSPLVTWWLRASGEPFRWSLPRDELAAFLASTGLRSSAGHATNHPSTLVARGEFLCEARPATRTHSTDKPRRSRPFHGATRTP